MSVRVSERAFEDAVEAALLRYGPDEVPSVPGAVAETPPPYGDPDMRPGGYRRSAGRRTTTARSASCRAMSLTSCRRRSRRYGSGSRSTMARRCGSGS